MVVLFDDLGDLKFIDFDQKWVQKAGSAILPFWHFSATLFRTLLPFTLVRPTSARNHFFQFVFQQIKTNIHICTLYLRKTCKCTVAAFTILTKNQCKRTKTSNAPRLDFGTVFASFGILWDPFWLHLVCVGYSF